MNWDDQEKILLRNPRYKKALKETELEYQIARQLILVRINRNLTQKALAKKLQTKQSVISRVESGNHLPSVSFLQRLAVATGTNLTVSFGS